MGPIMIAPTANSRRGRAHGAGGGRRQPATAAWTTAAWPATEGRASPRGWSRRRAACAPRDGGVRERQDVVGGHELLGRHRRALRPDQRHGDTEGQPERGLVVGVHGRVQVLVEHGQLGGGVVVDPELPLAEDADYHSPSPACGCCAAGAPAAEADSPPSPLALASSCFGALLAISRFIASSSDSTPLLAPSLSSSAWM